MAQAHRRSASIPARAAFLLLLLFSPLALAFGPPRLVESDAAQLPLYPNQLPLIGRFRPVGVSARAALLMDAATGRVIYEQNAQQRLAPASLTKIMTAVVALERGNLQSRVAIQPKHLIWGSSMGLAPGDVVTLEDLLWGLLLPSGNDAALAIADHVGKGSLAAFLELMNERAADLGLQDTHFMNPHGLDEPGHFSSAHDLALLTRYALGHPLFARIVATPQTVRYASRPFLLENSNRLVLRREFPGVDGVKSGITDDAGDSMVASWTRESRRLIAVVLGTADRHVNAANLLEFALGQFMWVRPKPGLPLTFFDSEGTRHTLALAGAPEALVPLWARPYLRSSLQILKRHNPYWPGTRVGFVSYTLAGSPLGQQTLSIAPP